jgi:hypothetical protein
MITGIIAGFNFASWHFAGIIAEGYTELIQSKDGQLYVNEGGILYQLTTVDSKSLEDKLVDAIEKHDKNMIEVEKAEIYHDKEK